MSAIETLLADLDHAIRNADGKQRHAVLERSAALFAAECLSLADHQLTIFDDVILSLTGDVGIEDKVRLAERFADLPRLPKKTAARLACDDNIAISGPLILRSPALDDDLLAAIARDKSDRHLSLLVRRRVLPDAVLDIMIERGDTAILIEIARNENRPISDQALRRLAERALELRPLYRILRSRPDFATRHIGAVIEAARFRARANGALGDMTEMMTRDMYDETLARTLALTTAKSIADSAHLSVSRSSPRKDQPANSDADLADLLERDQIDDALAALAAQTGLAVESVTQAFHAPQYEPLLFLLRGQNYPLTTMLHFMRHKYGDVSTEFESQIGAAYCGLAHDTAKRLVTFLGEKYKQPADAYNTDDALRHSA